LFRCEAVRTLMGDWGNPLPEDIALDVRCAADSGAKADIA
jgi:hypothetical protein